MSQYRHQHEKFVALEYPKTALWEALNVIIITMTLLSIITQVIWSLGLVWQTFADQILTIDIAIGSILALDRFYRYLCSQDQIWFIFNSFSLIELWSFLPFFVQLIAVSSLGDWLPVLSALWKICMVIRLLRYFKILNHLYKAVKSNRYKYEIALILLVSLRIISGMTIHYIESGVNHQFDSIPASLRWSIVTMSTVWYGDLVPQTTLGKLMGWLVIFFWPVFLGIISSITVVTFLDMLKYHHKYKQLSKCHKCFNAENDVNARYCKICGTMLDQKAQEEDTHTASIL